VRYRRRRPRIVLAAPTALWRARGFLDMATFAGDFVRVLVRHQAGWRFSTMALAGRNRSFLPLAGNIRRADR